MSGFIISHHWFFNKQHKSKHIPNIIFFIDLFSRKTRYLVFEFVCCFQVIFLVPPLSYSCFLLQWNGRGCSFLLFCGRAHSHDTGRRVWSEQQGSPYDVDLPSRQNDYFSVIWSLSLSFRFFLPPMFPLQTDSPENNVFD